MFRHGLRVSNEVDLDHSRLWGSRRPPRRRSQRAEAAIMRHRRWKSVQITRRYIRQGGPLGR
jgi:hypothetical protein